MITVWSSSFLKHPYRNKYSVKKYVPLDLQLYEKETPTQMFSSEINKIFKDCFYVDYSEESLALEHPHQWGITSLGGYTDVVVRKCSSK